MTTTTLPAHTPDDHFSGWGWRPQPGPRYQGRHRLGDGRTPARAVIEREHPTDPNGNLR